MKKYLLLIPTLFVMLLNVIGCGQVVFAAESVLDYSEFFLYDLSDLSAFNFDFTDYDAILSTFNLTSSHPYYFYTISAKLSDYNSYIEGAHSLESLFQLDLFFFEDEHLQNAVENNYYLRLNSPSYRYCYLTAKQSSQYYPFGGLNGSVGNLFYYKNTGTAVRSPDSSYKNEDYCNERIYFYQSTNIPDFPFPDFVNHGGPSDELKVDVHFKPNLSGEVERMSISEDGTKSFASQFRFTLTNNSSFPIQYTLYILKKSDEIHLAKYDDRYVFMYYSNDWVYSQSLDDDFSYGNLVPSFQNKGTKVHYVSSGESVAVFFNYSQINLKENVDYTVYVTATRCDLDHASEIFIDPVRDITPDMKGVRSHDIVYQSDFSMVHYSDVKYDSKDSSNGVLPFSSAEDIKRYSLSYNAAEDSDGKIDYTAKDVYSDKNSWYNSGGSWSTSDSSVSLDSPSSSSDFSSLSRSFSSFFSFVNATFNYFPSSYKMIISLGLTAIVVLALIKAVFR